MGKYLILRFSSIGDIVLTTPVIRCLKQQTGAEVHYLTRKSFARVLEGNPYIDKLYTVDKSAAEIIDSLKAQKYDAVIDLHHNLRTLYVKSKLRIPSFSLNKLNVEKWIMVNLKVNRLPAIHIVDRYFETVKSFGVVNDNKGLDYFIPAGSEVDVSSINPDLAYGYVAFVIGAKHFTKMFPMEKVASVCSKLQRPVVLLGGKEDAERAERIVEMIRMNNPGKAPFIYNAAGKFSLHQSASLVKQADAVITNDTGLMHIAAAFNKNIVSLWGNTIPEFGMVPYLPEGGQSKIFEYKGLYCRPCSKIGFNHCPQKHFKCMNELDENGIADSVNSAGVSHSDRRE